LVGEVDLLNPPKPISPSCRTMSITHRNAFFFT
jgi:hypothetical protein